MSEEKNHTTTTEVKKVDKTLYRVTCDVYELKEEFFIRAKDVNEAETKAQEMYLSRLAKLNLVSAVREVDIHDAP